MKTTLLNIFYLLLAIAVFTSCAHSNQKWQAVIPDTFDTSIVVSGSTGNEVKLLYTGCGGMLIAYKDEAILTDPFYTGHTVSQVRFSGIRIDTVNTLKVLKAIDADAGIKPQNINAVLVAHSHYDHLEDLPYLLKRNVLDPKVKIIGDTSTHCTIKPFLQPEQRFVLADTVCKKWVKVSAHLRVMMIEADHAPHFWFFKMMGGNTCKDSRLKTFDDPVEETRGFGWRRGKVYSWLIDVLDDQGRIALRMFMQSSSCNPSKGFPPREVLTERPVDIAMLGVASFQNVKCYPESLLSCLQPKKVVLIHWEDFFTDLYGKEIKTVRLTNFNKFFRRMKGQYQCKDIETLGKNGVIMPRPLTLIKVNY